MVNIINKIKISQNISEASISDLRRLGGWI